MSTSRAEVLIVGGGPAGGALAILLAQQGRQVVLIDHDSFPRDKVCGECLGSACWPILEHLGIADLVAPHCRPLHRVRIHPDGGRPVVLDLESDGLGTLFSLDRYVLDQALLQQAERCGVEVRTGHRVRRVLLSAGRATGVELVPAAEHHAAETVDCQLLIAADGRQSLVVKQTGMNWRRGPTLVGFKRHLIAPPPLGDSIDPPAAVDLVSMAGSYLGLCPLDESRWNVCGLLPRQMVQQCRGDLDLALRQLLVRHPVFSDWLQAAPAGSWLTVPDVRLQRCRPTTAGVYYAGDALGTIEPLAGQGISMALAGAQLLAHLLSDPQMMRAESSGQRAYESAWRRQFKQPLAWAGRFGLLLRSPRLLRWCWSYTPLTPAWKHRVVRHAYAATRLEAAS